MNKDPHAPSPADLWYEREARQPQSRDYCGATCKATTLRAKQADTLRETLERIADWEYGLIDEAVEAARATLDLVSEGGT